MAMRNDLEALISKYGNPADLAKELKKLQGGDVTKRSKLEAGLDKLLAEYGTISLTRFKKEAARAWNRAFPDGLEKRELKGYQLFVKEKMSEVKTANPAASHSERMAIIGRMWQAFKTPTQHPLAPEVPEAPETPDDDEQTETEEPEPEERKSAKRDRKPTNNELPMTRRRRAI